MASKKVLITGGAGFIGGHLSKLFLEKGWEVTIIDNLLSGRMENIEELKSNPNFKFVIEDIRNEMVIDRLASDTDLIIHLAAALGVFSIVNSPLESLEINIDGTEKVLKAANRYKKKILIASTSEVYGKSTKYPYAEDDDTVFGATTKNRWSYAAAKQLDEFMGLAYYNSYNLPVVVFRLFNTVGPRQRGHYGMVVPRFVKWALKNEDIQIYGDGTQSRCFGNVFDVIEAIYKLSQEEKALGQVFNIGSTDELTIKQLAEKVIELTGSKSQIKLIPYENVYGKGFEDMTKRVPDITKIKATIDWKPTTKIDDTLMQVIEYEKVND